MNKGKFTTKIIIKKILAKRIIIKAFMIYMTYDNKLEVAWSKPLVQSL